MNVRPISPAPGVLAAPLALCLGCGSGGSGGFAGEVGTYEPDGGLFLGSGDASASAAFDASIEQNHVAVKFITLSCSGSCAEVQAVGTGGYLPYTFKWDDGSTTATRQVCPMSSTSYSVKVTDTGTSGELARPAETVQVPLAANVIACPDGGSVSGGDGGGGFCVADPSFEGTPTPTLSTSTNIGAPPWVACVPSGAGFPNAAIVTGNESSGIGAGTFPPASDGATYLSMNVSANAVFATGIGDVSGPLCEPLHSGVTYSLMVDLASYLPSASYTALSSLEILGSTASCSQGRLLWSSPPAAPTWKTYCATFTPSEETTYLGLTGSLESDAGTMPMGTTLTALGVLLVDHVVPVDACP
jgi:hypothetical protein